MSQSSNVTVGAGGAEAIIWTTSENEPSLRMAQEPGTLVACNRLRQLFGIDCTLYECRDCGANLDSEDEECPACGGTEIARYDL